MSKAMNFNERPILVFWELTKACKLKCKHCRAEAIPEPLPGELTLQEGLKLLEDIRRFGKPYPVLILTGGDPLMREDLEEIMRYAKDLGIRMGIAPAVTDLLNNYVLSLFRRYGIRFISISLDGTSKTHDYIRGIEGHFERTVRVLRELVGSEWTVQVNTLVSRDSVMDLPHIFKLISDLGIGIWELFFLIKVGRGIELGDLSPQEYEDVVNFLYEVSRYGIEVRTVEAPFFRRVMQVRSSSGDVSKEDYIESTALRYGLGPLYVKLTSELFKLMGPPEGEPRLRSAYTRDGYGIIFVAYNGDVYPSGFAPLKLGNVKVDSLVDIYRESEVLRKIRRAEFKGRCGICEFRYICGGSRARALAIKGDILEEDPACVYLPKS